MGKLKRLEIQLDKQYAVYRAGDILKGTVIIELKKSMKMKNIYVYSTGRAKVHYTGQYSGYRGKQYTRPYKAEEIYFEQSSIVYGLDRGTTTLQAGVHTFNFTITLNLGLPSSFEGPLGSIRYICKATIVKPWKFNHDVKKPFTVIGHLDLNYESPALRGPAVGETTRHPTGCCISGEVTALLRINKRLFVPGEYVHIYAVINNKSNTLVKSTRLFLEQDVTYSGRVDGDMQFELEGKTCHNFIESRSRGQIRSGATDIWDNIEMLIPPLPPSRLFGCDIINVSYSINFYADIEHVSSAVKLQLKSDIIIGTIPLREQTSTLQPSGPIITQPQPTAPPVPYNPSAPPAQPGEVYIEMNDLPPSYEECVQGKVHIREDGDTEYTHGDMEWAPSYPYYPTLRQTTGSAVNSAATPSDMNIL